MSKRRQKAWDDDGLALYKHHESAGMRHSHLMDEDYDPVETEEVAEVLDEAHEAMSRLFQKTSKRNKEVRGLRRQDAWH